jgi:hypothetical protein
MNPQHKAMKVQTLFTFSRQALIEQIHQPGFSSADAAPHIEAANGSRFGNGFALAQQFAEFGPQTAAGLRRDRRFILQFLINRIEAADRFSLDVVRLMAPLLREER